ncbi:hypothetical protein SUGI_0856090 [Cryptomeria japonica]|nr:hypothetical protein SUGI_0856090 [Cryptomeria japonica]
MEDGTDGVDDMTDLSMHVVDLEHRHSDLVDLESQFIVEGDKEEAQEEYDLVLCPQKTEKVILEQKNVWVEHDSDSNQQVDSSLFDTDADWTFVNPLFKFDVGIPFDFSDEGGSHCRIWDLGAICNNEILFQNWSIEQMHTLGHLLWKRMDQIFRFGLAD